MATLLEIKAISPPTRISRTRREIMNLRFREYIRFDSFLFRKFLALLFFVAGLGFSLLGKKGRALQLFSRLHRTGYSRWATKYIEGWFRTNARNTPGGSCSTAVLYEAHVEDVRPGRHTSKFFAAPAKLLGTRILVLKSPGDREK